MPDVVHARHLIAPSPAPRAPSLRSTVLTAAAAIGAVATGTFTALLPTPGDAATTASATTASADTRLDATLAAATTTLTLSTRLGPAAMLPVSAEEIDSFAAADAHLALLGKATDIATKIAEEHAAEQRAQAERDRLDDLIAHGGLDGWIAEALRTLDLPQSYAPGVKKIIMAESGGNPRAINRIDSNARAGTPSQGLMQTIPSTFRAYVHPRYAGRPITDPVANITAGIRYMISHYGTGTLKAGGRSNSSGDYVGY